jgi:hypothetical protein
MNSLLDLKYKGNPIIESEPSHTSRQIVIASIGNLKVHINYFFGLSPNLDPIFRFNRVGFGPLRVKKRVGSGRVALKGSKFGFNFQAKHFLNEPYLNQNSLKRAWTPQITLASEVGLD